MLIHFDNFDFEKRSKDPELFLKNNILYHKNNKTVLLRDDDSLVFFNEDLVSKIFNSRLQKSYNLLFKKETSLIGKRVFNKKTGKIEGYISGARIYNFLGKYLVVEIYSKKNHDFNFLEDRQILTFRTKETKYAVKHIRKPCEETEKTFEILDN